VDGESLRRKNFRLFFAHNPARPEPVTWTQRVQRLQKEAHVFYLVFKHPRTAWYARLVAACTAGYLVSPIQLIPNFIPVIGSLDDVLVLYVGMKLLQRMSPPGVLTECRDVADAAENRRREESNFAASVGVPIAVVTIWILAAAGVSALMAAYIYR
jgi:uncharacterized membrane protein YkvA (DUF1232 family)